MNNQACQIMYKYLVERFDALARAEKFTHLSCRDAAEMARLAGIICQVDGIERSKLLYDLDESHPDNVWKMAKAMNGATPEDVYYENNEAVDGTIFSVLVGPTESIKALAEAVKAAGKCVVRVVPAN